MEGYVESLKKRRKYLETSIDNLKRTITDLENMVKKLTKMLLNECKHEEVDEIRYFDGHKYDKEWYCNKCENTLYNLTNDTKVINYKYCG